MPNASNTPNSPVNSSVDELAKSYEPAPIEAYWGPEWERRGIADATLAENKGDFSVQLPPPNVTGTLHMGHAFNQTIMDGLVRHARMSGKIPSGYPAQTMLALRPKSWSNANSMPNRFLGTT